MRQRQSSPSSVLSFSIIAEQISEDKLLTPVQGLPGLIGQPVEGLETGFALLVADLVLTEGGFFCRPADVGRHLGAPAAQAVGLPIGRDRAFPAVRILQPRLQAAAHQAVPPVRVNPLKYIANAIGIAAVVMFVLSYQQKKRQGIVLCNVISRALYVVQYLLLGAFEGAVLDIVGMVASVLAQKKDAPFIKKHLKAVIIGVNILIIVFGIALYKSPMSLLPMFGVLFHTGAFWLEKEKNIRIISFIGSPFWLIYNLASGAFGSAIGDVMTMASIGLAILRYDILKNADKE